MAETDVSDSSGQVTSSKYSSRLTYGLLAFIGGFAGLHTFYRTGKSRPSGLYYLGVSSIFLSLTTIGISMLFSCL